MTGSATAYRSMLPAIAALAAGDDLAGIADRTLAVLVDAGFAHARWYDVVPDPLLDRHVAVATAERPRGRVTAPSSGDRLTEVTAPDIDGSVSVLELGGVPHVQIPVVTDGVLAGLIVGETSPELSVPPADAIAELQVLGSVVGALLPQRTATAVRAARAGRHELGDQPPERLAAAVAAELGDQLQAEQVAVFAYDWTGATLEKVREWSAKGRDAAAHAERYRVGEHLTGAAWTDPRLRHVVSLHELKLRRPELLGTTTATTALFAIIGRLDRRYLFRITDRVRRRGAPFVAEAALLKTLTDDLAADFDAALAKRRSRNVRELSTLTTDAIGVDRFPDRLAQALADEGVRTYALLSHELDSPQLGYATFRGELAGLPLSGSHEWDTDQLCVEASQGACRVLPVTAGGDPAGLAAQIRGRGFRRVVTIPLATETTTGALLVPLSGSAARRQRRQEWQPDDCSEETVSTLQTYAQLAGAAVDSRRAFERARGARRVLGLIGHELRAPLAALNSTGELAIVAARQALREADVSDNGRIRGLAAIGRYEREFWDRQRDVSAALELAPLVSAESAGSLQLHFTRVRLDHLLRGAVDDVTLELGDERARYAFHALRSLEGHDLVADATFLRHAFKNVLRNAAKYSLPSGRSRAMLIDLYAEPQTNFIGVKIRNWGHGIPEEKRDFIFDPWVRGDVVDAHRAIRGMGLGLFLARRIVTAHLGRILFTSNPTLNDARRTTQLEGFETIFEIRLPRDLPQGTHVYRFDAHPPWEGER